MRARLAEEAERRSIKVATAARVLLEEALRNIDDQNLLSEAEEWQRAQAWATWDKIQAGDVRDVPQERLDEHAAAAVARMRAKAQIPRRQRPPSGKK